MVRNLFFVLGWIGLFVLAALGVYISIFPSYIYALNVEGIVFRGTLVVVSLFYILLFIEKILIIFEKKKDFEVKNENGKLIVSGISIDNLSKEVTSRIKDFKSVRTTNKIKGKKLFVSVKVDAYSDSDIAKNVMEAQEKIKKEIFEYLAIEVEGVEVKVVKLLKRKNSTSVTPEGSEF